MSGGTLTGSVRRLVDAKIDARTAGHAPLDYDWCSLCTTDLAVPMPVDAANHIAYVEVKETGARLWAPYGKGLPLPERDYQLWQWRDMRWLNIGGNPWCKTWTSTSGLGKLACAEAYTSASVDTWRNAVLFRPTNNVTEHLTLTFRVDASDAPTGSIRLMVGHSGFDTVPLPWPAVAGMEDVELTSIGQVVTVTAGDSTDAYLRLKIISLSGFGGSVTLSISAAEDFNQCGATFSGQMLEPALRDRLELPRVLIYGDGHDGAGSGGDPVRNLNTESICGRSTPDMACTIVSFWAYGNVTNPEPPHTLILAGIVAPIPDGVVEGDEIVIYQSQSRGDVSTLPGVSRWETHRVAGLFYSGELPVGLYYTDYVRLPILGPYFTYIQRVPNYTTVEGNLTVNAYNYGGTGTGFMFLRASVSSGARYDVSGKGYTGYAGSPDCGDLGTGCPYQPSGDGLLWDDACHKQTYGGGGGAWVDCCEHITSTDAHPYSPSGSYDGPPPYNHYPLNGGGGGGGGSSVLPGAEGSGSSHRVGAFSAPHATGLPIGYAALSMQGILLEDDIELFQSPRSFQTINGLWGRSYYGGGGGTGTQSVDRGGNGGGWVALFAPVIGGSHTYPVPTVHTLGNDAEGAGGGGGAGSILLWCDSISTTTYFEAETVNIAGSGQGVAGRGGSVPPNVSCGFIASGRAGGHGAMGHIEVHCSGTNNGTFYGVLDVYPSTLHFTGCWSSETFSSVDFGLPAGLVVFPETLSTSWSLDSGGTAPRLYLKSSSGPDFSSGVVRYPSTGAQQWQDGTALDIDNGVTLQLDPYLLAPDLYWRVEVCLDSGLDPSDTPSIQDIAICGLAF